MYFVIFTRKARFPYIAKKYGHLLDGYEYYSEIETCKVNFKSLYKTCWYNSLFQPTLESSLTRNEPTEFSFRRRQFVKYARNEKDMNFCRNNTQLLNFKVGVFWLRQKLKKCNSSSVCSVKVCLELLIFIFLAQVSFSSVFLRSVPSLSQLIS